jgi:hypothetical protein
MGGCGLDSPGSGEEPMAGSYVHDNESSGSIQCTEFLYYLRKFLSS